MQGRPQRGARWDRGLLAAELGELAYVLQDSPLELAETGFEIAEIDSITLDHSDEMSGTHDDVIPVIEAAVSRSGDLWLMKDHRLQVGDARRPDDVSRLMGGEFAAMMITDPPYNVSITRHARRNSCHREFAMASGEMSNAEFATFLRTTFTCSRRLAGWSNRVCLHRLAAYGTALWLVQQGAMKRLIINVPPRSLKSMIGSVALPAFILGHDPTKRIIAASYADPLAHDLSNQFRAVVQARWYQAAFPEMVISKKKNTEGQIATTQHGFRLATSTEGTLTGRGGNVIIIDDPLKADDANSEAKRAAANRWFVDTLQSRLDNKQEGAIILIMQRLHMDDLTGFLLSKSDDWKVLRLPAIAEETRYFPISDFDEHHCRIGDVLNPGLEPMSVLNRLKKEVGSSTFEAQYQQNPVPPGGAMIKRDWLRWYEQPPKTKFIFQSWDTAAKEGGQNDWSVCTTWAVDKGNFYLLDVFRKRLAYPDLRREAEKLWRRWRANKVYVEDIGIGTGLVTELKRAGIPAIAIVPKDDKISRVALQSAKFEAGFVHFRKDAPWLADLLTELLSFPNGRHDDQVDSITQALANIKVPRDPGAIVDFMSGVTGGPTWIEMQYGPYGLGRGTRRFW